jgi:hypothetical protein
MNETVFGAAPSINDSETSITTVKQGSGLMVSGPIFSMENRNV